MKLWEYFTAKIEASTSSHTFFEHHKFNDYANSMGAKGWEIVSSFDANSFHGGSKEFIVIFKREKQD